MSQPLRFRYFLSDEQHPISEGTPLWHSALPSRRDLSQATRDTESRITYAEYFNAATQFLKAEREWIIGLAESSPNADSLKGKSGAFAIFLEKHGAFYHPSRIRVTTRGRTRSFVLNVAISDIGRLYLKQEVGHLKRLTLEFPYTFLPRVYRWGRVAIDEKRNLEMFLGEWFAGYSEFHASQDRESGLSCIKVWRSEQETPVLSKVQAVEVYAGAAEILTAYYNLETSEQISSWHHAAGDFVMKQEPDGIRVKLVTARRYEPMMEIGGADPQQVLQGLLLFLLSMSIRMRLDRVGGVGELTWLGDEVLEGVLRGFLRGLERKEKTEEVPAGFAAAFRSYLLRLPQNEIEDALVAIAERRPQNDPELPIIKARIRAHANAFNPSLTRL